MKYSLAAGGWRSLFLLSLHAGLISAELIVLAFLPLCALSSSLEYTGQTKISDRITPVLPSSECLSLWQ